MPRLTVDALQGAVAIMTALFADAEKYPPIQSDVPSIQHPHFNIGRIEDSINTTVVPSKVVLKVNPCITAEAYPAQAEASTRTVSTKAVQHFHAQRDYEVN